MFLDNTQMPEIDADLPLPKCAAEAMPSLTPAEELDMRVRTMKLLADLTGQPLVASEENRVEATELARRMIEDPLYRPQYAKYPNETMAYLAGMVAQSNCMIVEDLAELKLYVTNKLVYEVEHAENGKVRIQALKLLGEVDGVDAFKRRSEVTMTIKPIEEVEKELKDILEGIEYHVVRQEQISETGKNGKNGQKLLENEQNSPENDENSEFSPPLEAFS